MHKHAKQSDLEEEPISSEFLDELNRGGLQIPTLNMYSLCIVQFIYMGNLLTPERHERSISRPFTIGSTLVYPI